MLKKLQVIISLLILAAAIFWGFYGTKPHVTLVQEVPLEQFSTAQAFSHVENLSQEPRYVGSQAHRKARNYIVPQLEKMGLLVQTQEGFSLNKYGTITRPQNIISRIEGSGEGKAVLLLTHYDSAMHSSFGASDAASGIATILEGVRAFLASGKTPKNDIILVFSDAEELGLLGALLFAEEHPWAKEVGLVLNFEARGSGGSSFMLPETNQGNKALIEGFLEAGVEYPVTNSLAYSVYKILPNDTDLTVLRERENINGFNFVFFDDFYDYHTATDVPENLDINSLAHQGSYLVPLLNYFSEAPLEGLVSQEDVLFFNIPIFGLIIYPDSWTLPLLILVIIGFIALIFYGSFQKKLPIKKVLKGFLPLLISLFASGFLVYGLWQLALYLYPQYREMEHGFPYNGYNYIVGAVFLSLAVCFYTYNFFRKPKNTHQLFVAPLLLWILISVLAALYLRGAAYVVVLVFFGMIQLFILFHRPKYALLAQSFLSLPAIFILTPLLVLIPVVLGLKVLFLSAILCVLIFVLLWPVFGFYKKNQWLGFFSFFVFLIFVTIAHFQSEFNEARPKPNSLVYVMDEDKNIATWNTYDGMLDPYTAPFFNDSAEIPVELPEFQSKYQSRFTRSAIAPKIILPEPFIGVEKLDTAKIGEDLYEVKIAPNRDVNRFEFFADKNQNFLSFTVNGKEADSLQRGNSLQHIFKNRWDDRLLTYYPVNRDTLRLQIAVEEGQQPKIELYEAAFTLHEEQQLKVPSRTEEMVPRPFVLNDAILLKKTFQLK